MKSSEPLEIDLKFLTGKQIVRHNEFRFIVSDFGFVDSMVKMEPGFFRFGQPYRLKEGRIAFVKKGWARVSINLIEYIIKPGILSLATANSIIQVTKASPDFDAGMIAIGNDFLPIPGKEEFLTHLLQSKKNLLITLSPREYTLIESFFALTWNIVQENTFRREVVRHLMAGLLYNVEYIIQYNRTSKQNHLTRQEDLFQQFISLVNTYSKSERSVSFYADKLCLTPRYLNTVIRQSSRQTVMDWVNQSIIMEAKVMLKYSNLLIYQISDELNFPNPSFFCKFFKRMTGMTPQEYQKS